MRNLVLLSLFAAAALSCKRQDPWEKGKRVFHMGLRASIASFEPVRASTNYDSLVLSAVYQPLLQYDYLARPLELRPLLLESMPEVSPDLKTYTFRLRRGVLFHDDPCFANGVGRELVAGDVIHSIKRMADRSLAPTGWWIYNDRIAGFDELAERFDYDTDVPGLRALDDHTVVVELTAPYPQFLYALTTLYTAIVPEECARRYGIEMARHPVGTGPFRLKEWIPGQRVVFEKNPKYWDERYRGERIPFLDGIVMHIYEQDQPMWLKWRVGDIDFIQTPADYQPSAFDEHDRLRERFVEEGVGAHVYEVIDMVYKGFEMGHPITGGERGKLVRQAIAAAMDMEELIEAFYNGTAVAYDGPIPPGLDGHPERRISPYRGPNLSLAKELLAKAGYPGGEGLPPIQYHTNRVTASIEQTEMLSRQLAEIGVRIIGNYHSFPELDSKIKKRQCQMFGLSWTADYPDAENFLALFYGANQSPGSNASNYVNPEYDALYEKSRLMQPSPERTVIYERMRDLVIEDAPVIGTLARKRYYVWNARVKNVVPEEVWFGWIKYVDVDPR
jgi:ABC-type transport system substrate-binding protein